MVEVLLAYAAVGIWIVTLRDTVRRGGSFAAAFALVVSAIVFAWPFAAHRGGALALIAASAASYAILLLFRRMTPAPVAALVKIRREDQRQTFLHLVLITGSIIFMVPFVWLVSTSLKDDEDIFTNQIRIIPQRPVKQSFGGGEALELVTVDSTFIAPGQKTTVRQDVKPPQTAGVWAKVKDLEDTVEVAPVKTDDTLGAVIKALPDGVHKIKRPGIVWENYPKSLEYLPEETHKGLVYLGNTVQITVLSILGTLLTASMVAFSFARLRWPGRDALFILLLSTMMLPYAVTMIPQFLIWQKLHGIDTLYPLWAGAFLGGGAFNIFLLRQFFMTIPSELEEAAKIDGCSYWRTFWTIMLPLVRPALATVAIMTFMGSWNNFMGPLIYISSPLKMPVAYALQLYQSVHGGQYGYLMAASTLVMLPVLLVFFFCQRYFIQGITLTGLKG